MERVTLEGKSDLALEVSREDHKALGPCACCGDIGKWGDDTSASDRQAVSVAFRHLENGPAFMLNDSSSRNVASSSLISRALDREAVVGTPLAEQVFGVCDLVYLAAPRLAELR